ncbi:NADPH-dependent FMN reductase [Ferruginibacter yonginensis]|uniref:NADPH-dependent FMN reductase n=1 Tax=Ferruginibacter yonginensis TaxID=1310416 RepID=A0ABV8QWL5_9BACT
MITIIVGTNRKGSNSKKIALIYHQLLTEVGVESKVLSLDEHLVYEKNDAFTSMEATFLKPAERFIFIVPEYNGSYPGILKLMIDNSDVYNVWSSKKALLTGVSTGRAGNLRGLEHFTGALLHLKMNVHYNRLPLSVVHTMLDENGALTHEPTLNTIKAQINEFLAY